MPQVREDRSEKRGERERERERERRETNHRNEEQDKESDVARGKKKLRKNLQPNSQPRPSNLSLSLSSLPQQHHQKNFQKPPFLLQGGIDHLENPLAAAARELREETGIVSARVVAISRCWHVHDSPTRVADPLRPGEPGALLSYRGQTQKWVLMYYYGDRDEVDLGPEATREFSEWGWRVSRYFFFFFFFFFWGEEKERGREKETEKNLLQLTKK